MNIYHSGLLMVILKAVVQVVLELIHGHFQEVEKEIEQV